MSGLPIRRVLRPGLAAAVVVSLTAGGRSYADTPTLWRHDLAFGPAFVWPLVLLIVVIGLAVLAVAVPLWLTGRIRAKRKGSSTNRGGAPEQRHKGGGPGHGGDPVTVVGAGPAGLSCAIVLARNGRRVVVREAHDTVGVRFHGDFQGLENWSSAEGVLEELSRHGIDPIFEHHAVRAGVAFDAWGREYKVRSDRPLYHLVRRGSGPGTLDQGLLTLARDAGVEIRFGDRVRHVADSAVLAGGPRVPDAIAVGYVFETDMPDGNWVWFDNRLAPLGYSYLLVHAGRGTVASCMFAGFKREAEYVARTVAAFSDRVGFRMRNPRPFGGFANFRLPRTGVQGGHLVIGEHAGFQDALAGFGMRYAIRSGILAARSLIEGRDYTSLWREALSPAMRASVTNRLVFNLAGERGRRWMLARRLSAEDAGAELRNLYNPSTAKTLLFPIAYWRFRARLRDKSCDHVNCECVWCRCGVEAVAAAS